MQNKLMICNLNSDGNWTQEYAQEPLNLDIILGGSQVSKAIGKVVSVAFNNQLVLSVIGATSFTGFLEFSNDGTNWVKETVLDTDFPTGNITLRPITLIASGFNLNYAVPMNYQFVRLNYGGSGTAKIQISIGNC